VLLPMFVFFVGCDVASALFPFGSMSMLMFPFEADPSIFTYSHVAFTL